MRTNAENIYVIESGPAPDESWYGHKLVAREVVTVTYVCESCERMVALMPDGTYRHVPRGNVAPATLDYERWNKERRKVVEEARLANTESYDGAIAQCQAGITTNDRASIHYRCERKPRFVVVDWKGRPMAVCGVHARHKSIRYRGGYRQAGADEQLEERYL